jgi:hypothetical protein
MTTQQMGEEGFRWWLGIVEDIQDPKQLGRAKVRILNEHDEDVDTGDIEWAHVIMPATSACVDGVGDTPNLAVGSRVVGFFMDGNEKQMPMIIGSFPTIPGNDDNRHSLSWLHRGKNTVTRDAIGPEPTSPYAAQYPYNRTITTKAGHVIELDDTPENQRINIQHASGAYIEINNDGRVVIKSPVDSFDIVGGQKQIYVKGDCTIKSESLVTIDSPTVKMTGDLQVTGEVTGNGIKLSTHTHGGVQTGGSRTQRPN